MDKPDWKDAPEWAEWLAQDADGEWNWYKEEPLPGHEEWLISDSGCGSAKAGSSTPVEEWAETLERRPGRNERDVEYVDKLVTEGWVVDSISVDDANKGTFSITFHRKT